YVYSLLRNFYEDCNRCEVDSITDQGNEDIFDATRLISNLIDEEKSDALLNECLNKNILLGYRCYRLIEIFVSGKNISKIITNHQTRVKQHLQRLYRIRNAIVHTARSEFNLKLFTKHLDDYVESTISTISYRLANGDDHIPEILSTIIN